MSIKKMWSKVFVLLVALTIVLGFSLAAGAATVAGGHGYGDGALSQSPMVDVSGPFTRGNQNNSRVRG